MSRAPGHTGWAVGVCRAEPGHSGAGPRAVRARWTRQAGVRSQGGLVLPSVAWGRPSSPWLAEVTLGVGHRVAPLRAEPCVVRVLWVKRVGGGMPPSGWRWSGAGPVGKNWGLGDRVLRPPPGTEGRPEAWGPGIPPVAPGRYLRAGEGCGATGCRVQGAFGASCTGTRGKAEAPAGAEGASWAGLAALFGGATWMGRRKGTGSMSPQGTTRPERGALALPGCCPTPCQAPCQVRAGHMGLLCLGGRQHGGHVGMGRGLQPDVSTPLGAPEPRPSKGLAVMLVSVPRDWGWILQKEGPQLGVGEAQGRGSPGLLPTVPPGQGTGRSVPCGQ